MDSPSLHPSSPSCATPLYPVSPERTNRQAALQSPSCLSPRLRSDPFFSSPHRNSDVQNKVSQFNQLIENQSPSPKRKENEAALRRAVLGREEAEARMKRIEDENATLKRSVEDGRSRERKIAQRVEAMMEDVQRHKESGTRAQAVYEKEIRRARKEAFKSSSALVKLQEELKTARNRYTLMREEVDVQKRKVEEKEQQSFSAQYKLVSYQEELESLQQRLKSVEQERDAFRTSLKEEEVARIAAEGCIALPPPTEDDEFATPRKSTSLAPINTPVREEALLDLQKTDRDGHIESLELELRLEQRLRQEAQETITFMKLECQLQACSCRRAEQEGNSYVHDQQLHALWMPPPIASPPMPEVEQQEDRAVTPDESVIINPAAKGEPLIAFSPAVPSIEQLPQVETPLLQLNFGVSPELDKENIAPTMGPPLVTPPLEPPYLAPPLAPTALSESPSLLSLPGRPSNECHLLPSVSAPVTPRQPQIPQPRITPRSAVPMPNRPHPAPEPSSQGAPPAGAAPEPERALRLITNTTTTKIPLADSDEGKEPVAAPSKFPFSPGATKTREEALKSIQKWREGRSRNRSVTAGSATQRRPVSGSPVRRDISAPERRVVS